MLGWRSDGNVQLCQRSGRADQPSARVITAGKNGGKARSEAGPEASASAPAVEGNAPHTGSVLLPDGPGTGVSQGLITKWAVTAPLCPWTLGGFTGRPAWDECPSVPAPRAAAGASRPQQQGLCVSSQRYSSHPNPEPDPPAQPRPKSGLSGAAGILARATNVGEERCVFVLAT